MKAWPRSKQQSYCKREWLSDTLQVKLLSVPETVSKVAASVSLFNGKDLNDITKQLIDSKNIINSLSKYDVLLKKLIHVTIQHSAFQGKNIWK